MRVLGISAFYHDSAAAIVVDGNIEAAAQEERFTRRRHDESFPANAVAYCLRAAGTTLDAIDYVAYYEKPFLKFERLLETYVAFAPRGFQSFRRAIPAWFHDKLFQKSILVRELEHLGASRSIGDRLLFAEHHVSHAASAFYPSPFESAAILTMDGVGEWATTTAGVGTGNRLELSREIAFPHSLGLLYSAFTYATGFRVNSGEYKVMGLAPYGRPRFVETILSHLIDVKEDGSYRLNQRYFDYATGLTMTNDAFHELFGVEPRSPEQLLEPIHLDLAASVQAVTELVVLRLARALRRETGNPRLCLSGGVALNAVANGKVLRDRAFDEVWIQPAAGDAGGAVGAALAAFHEVAGSPRTVRRSDGMRGAFLGPAFSMGEVEADLRSAGLTYERLDDAALFSETAADLAAGLAIGWFQGRMEFGPRALGARSILADPRSPDMQRRLNEKIKFRESFRPFAPAVLREDVAEWFDLDVDNPYMLVVADVLEKHRRHPRAELEGLAKLREPHSDIPAVTHVDYSARVQSVDAGRNPRFHALISAFKERTGCGVLINTSFNIRGEPIVCTPTDAIRCFLGTKLDRLVIENFIVRKDDQPAALSREYQHEVAPD